MRRSRIMLLAVAAVATLALAALVPLSPGHQAAADTPTPTPTPPCRPSPTPGTGTTLWAVSATLPGTATLNANSVCVNCTGTGGQNNTATLFTNAAGCGAAPVVGAGGSSVWADWATACVLPGNTVVINFKSAVGPLAINTVEWRLSDGGVIAGTGSAHVVAASVGGIAELPDVSGSSGPPYALLAGALAAVLALTAGALYARRRLS